MTTTFLSLPAPFDGAPTLVEARGRARVWLTSPAGMVTQVATGASMDRPIAAWLMAEPTLALRAHASRRGERALRFVHDWRGVEGYDAEARRLLVEWGLSFARGEIERIDALLPLASRPLLAMAVSAGRLAMIAGGVRMEVGTDPVAALDGLAPAEGVVVTPR